MDGKRFGKWVVRWRWLVIAASLIMVVSAGRGAQYLGFSTDYRVFFSEENPQLKAFEAIQNIYSKKDNVLFAIAPENGNVFTRETLAIVEALTAAAWEVPYSSRVDSVTNFQNTWADGDDLVVEDLVKGAASLTEDDLVRIRQIALSEPLLANRLVSPSAHVTGVNVTINLPGKSPGEVTEVVTHVREMAETLRGRYPEIKVYLSGMAMMNNAFNEASQEDMGSLMPLMFFVLLATMALLLRSVSGTLATILVIVFATVTAMGIAGWMGVLLTPPSASAPTIILTLAIADSIHLLITMLHEMRKGRTKHEAIVESLRINLLPVFLTSLTTAIGFLSLNSSDAPPFHDLGNISAIGVTAAFFLSIFFLPAMVAVLPIRVKAEAASGPSPFMTRFGEWVVGHRKALFWGMMALILTLLAGISRIRLDDQFVNYFDKRYAFRTDTDFIVENLSGIYQIEYSLGSDEAGGISDPDYLKHLEAFAKWYRQQPGILHVSTLSDTMKRLNRNMHGDDPAYYRLPEERDLSAQYLLLYELSLPFGLDLTDQINLDKSASRFTVTMKNLRTQEILAMEEKAQAWLKANVPTSMQSSGASPTLMFANISERNILSMIGGTGIALVLISGILILSFRSLKIGFISLIPNLVPAAMTFGLWGILYGQVGLAASIVAAMSFGIVVDDTVHFLSKYLRARREHQSTAEGGVRYAFKTVGTAIWVTSAILMAGFFVLTFSGFAINQQMGILTTIAVAFALMADLLFLPPLLMLLDRPGGAKEISLGTQNALEGGKS